MNELRDKIAQEIDTLRHTFADAYEGADQILSLIEGELAKAALWDKVKEVAKFADTEGCEGCPLSGTKCAAICCDAHWVVGVIEGKEG